MEHCHNTVHEDNAMLVRWELDQGRGAHANSEPDSPGSELHHTSVLPTAFNSGTAPVDGLNGGGSGKGGNGGGAVPVKVETAAVPAGAEATPGCGDD